MEVAQSCVCFTPCHPSWWVPSFDGVTGMSPWQMLAGGCATQILWDPFYQLSAHPPLLLRKLLLTSVTFSRRLALAKWNCFARKFWELYHSTHSPWCPVVSNRLGLRVTKASLLFFMAGWTLPGNLCSTTPHGIGMKLYMTQIHIPFPFFPCPILQSSLFLLRALAE